MPIPFRSCAVAAQTLVLLAALVPAWAQDAAEIATPPAPPPARVVSMNLCTDQLAMLLADPEQLISVSHLAADPKISALHARAEGWPANHGRAEEIFLTAPDLVVTGSYTRRAAAQMLSGLGIRVETFPPPSDLEDVRAGLIRMGDLLGHPQRAARLVADFDARLAALRDRAPGIDARPGAALYYANGYTLGDQTLAGQILTAAGYRPLATEAGIRRGGILPLELLVLLTPDLVVTGRIYPGNSRAEEILAHPALEALKQGREARSTPDWICGTPFVLNAIEALADQRQTLEQRP